LQKLVTRQTSLLRWGLPSDWLASPGRISHQWCILQYVTSWQIFVSITRGHVT
jgi:hypothetical protein